MAEPARLDTVESWTSHPNKWTRRAALVVTLPWTRQNYPNSQYPSIRDRILGWAAGYLGDHDWFIQKAVAWWVRDLPKHDAPRAHAFLAEAPRAHAFLAEHGPAMQAFARKEAASYLPPRHKSAAPLP